MGMARPRRIRNREPKKHSNFLSPLSSALSELLLIILLYLHALLSYLVHKFARCRKLRTPCMLCSRLDRKTPDFYKELFCNAHKLELSSLANRPPLPKRFQRKNITEKFGYNELKSEAESEGICSVNLVKEELLSRCLQSAPKNFVSEEIIVEEKRINPSPMLADICVSVPERRVEVDAHGLEEINWNQVEVKPASEVLIEQVPAENLSTKLDAADNCSVTSNGDSIKPLSSVNIALKTNQIMNEKLASNSTVPLPSPSSSDLLTAKDSSRIPEDLKSRLTQISTSRWLEFPWNDMSSTPQTNSQLDESKLSDASSSNGFPFNARRSIVDRCESGVESLDGSLSEIEGENVEDRLKRQIEMDRKFISVLYKELEEERNASAISANQAMCMINRLQEEKAAIQMEASQYLRMMEEQAEYDEEALQKLNDLLDDRDKEILDLEEMVNSYRKQFGGEPLTSRVLEESFDSEEREYAEYTPVSTPGIMGSSGCDIGKVLMRNTVLDFEDEKVHISECLKRFERKLNMFSNKNSVLEDEPMDNGENLNDRGSLVKVCSTPVKFSVKETLIERRLRSNSCNGRQYSMGVKKNDIVALGNEISQLSERLEALEEDRSFLEHAVGSLRNGSNGIQFVQEIACHLRELRQTGITQQEHIVT
ncbi:uncharacterized protein A4U43_C03F28750 [Asparagus officinalis]|uniref:GTD-binding domain-containing protein n=1 Tax=Asparagus officinalis TaxID=4686 RepID=A0A5P1FFK4_ASPOF|nr:myosin-binding protein 1-like [Asparagus officinalis]ONK76503.1 uncharacterized protein A4U43_C03F28750 [Asparagus officinalis]